MQCREQDIHEGTDETCSWLFQHRTFQEWLKPDGGLIWITGKPGAGKSTLLKYAVRKMDELQGAVILSFFFHSGGSELQRTVFGFHRSILCQLLKKAPSTSSVIVRDFEQKLKDIGKHRTKWDWHQNELKKHLKDSLLTTLTKHPIRIIVDALDECGEQPALTLVAELESLILGVAPNSGFGICLSCRHQPNLTQTRDMVIRVEEENARAIKTHVRQELRGSRHQLEIIDRAEGNFQWVGLVIATVQRLERQGEDKKMIESELRETPRKLSMLYERILEGLDPKSNTLLLKMIQWVCFALRPLTLDELRFTMVIDADPSFTSLKQCREAPAYTEENRVMESRVERLSGGLLETKQRGNKQIVQLIHESVRGFFVKEGGFRVLDSTWTPGDSAIGLAHHRLSRLCLRYLTMEEISLLDSSMLQDMRQNQSIDKRCRLRSIGWETLESQFPLLHYATTSWVKHSARAEELGVPQEDLLDYLGWPERKTLDRWNELYFALGDITPTETPIEGSIFHLVAEHGLTSVLIRLTSGLYDVYEINSLDSAARTPLSVAAEKGHKATKKLLIKYKPSSENSAC